MDQFEVNMVMKRFLDEDEESIVTSVDDDGNELALISLNGFSCVWFVLPDGRYKYSLRGNGLFDCSDLAASFGGGGHYNAAGFTLDYLFPSLIK